MSPNGGPIGEDNWASSVPSLLSSTRGRRSGTKNGKRPLWVCRDVGVMNSREVKRGCHCRWDVDRQAEIAVTVLAVPLSVLPWLPLKAQM